MSARLRHRASPLPWALAALLLTGCAAGVANDPGLDAALRVEPGSFFRGALPADGAGPAVLGAFLTQTRFAAGKQGKGFSAVLAGSATAGAIALEGDLGYWVVPAGPPPAEAPDALSLDATLSFSAELPAGEHTLRVWAVDVAGNFGASLAAAFQLTPPEPPAGELVVTLSWDTQSDLDLHLVLPDGTEVFHGNVNSWRAGGVAAAEEAWRTGGILDFDSNAQCVIDGRRRENIVWTSPPPSGSYAVRVDTPSLCGTSAARWHVEVWHQGALLGSARGSSPAGASRFGHDRGAGVLALEFQIP